MSDNIKYLNLGEHPVKYIGLFDKDATGFIKIKQKPINIVIKNILDINGMVPESVRKFDKDIPDFMVTKNGIIQISPLFYVSKQRPKLMNPGEENIYNNSVLIYCFASVGEKYSASPIEKYLMILLAYLKHYYETLNGIRVNIYRYLCDIEFAEYKTKNLVVYSGTKGTYKMSTLKAFDEDRVPETMSRMVGLQMMGEFIDKLAEKLDIDPKRIIVTSSYRSEALNNAIYAKKGLKPKKSSLHLIGRAIDIKVDGMSLNKVATFICGEAGIRLRRVIREVSGTSFDSLYSEDRGWIHAEMPNFNVDSILEDDNYFYGKITDNRFLGALIPTFKTATEAEVVNTGEKSILYDTEVILNEITSNNTISEASKSRIAFFAMTMGNSKIIDFFTRKPAYFATSNLVASAPIGNLNNMAANSSMSDMSIEIALKAKTISYNGFRGSKVYNYVKDEWENLADEA